VDHVVGQLVKALKDIKADTKALELQKEFYDRVRK
jgi:predicted transcriptional regulator